MRTALPDGIDLVATRPLVDRALEVSLALAPGDRPLVRVGDVVEVGDPLVERAIGPRLELANADGGVTSGDPWSGQVSGGLRRRSGTVEGELLAPVGTQTSARWRVVTAESRQPSPAPVAGRILEARPGVVVRIAASGWALRGALTAGSTARGRLELGADRAGELRAGGIDVGRAGTILVVGERVDAEALTRARAMGVRGVVVASLAGKDQRDFLASERRQRSGIHPPVAFAVFVLDGAVRRPIGAPVMELLAGLEGREVAIVADPPALVFDPTGVTLPELPPDVVRVRSGPLAGSEGVFVGLAGSRRFDAGTHLEAGWVRFGDEPPVALALADLERRT